MIQICLNIDRYAAQMCKYLFMYLLYLWCFRISHYHISLSLFLYPPLPCKRRGSFGYPRSLSLSPSAILGRTYGNLGSTREPTWCRSVF